MYNSVKVGEVAAGPIAYLHLDARSLSVRADSHGSISKFFADTILIGDTEYYDRTIYNCFFGATIEPEGGTAERIFTSFDMFPTTLAAMGFTIEGNRLGLGVNIFSSEPTLAERLGYEYLDTEIQKFSEYYIKEFS